MSGQNLSQRILFFRSCEVKDQKGKLTTLSFSEDDNTKCQNSNALTIWDKKWGGSAEPQATAKERTRCCHLYSQVMHL